MMVDIRGGGHDFLFYVIVYTIMRERERNLFIIILILKFINAK